MSNNADLMSFLCGDLHAFEKETGTEIVLQTDSKGEEIFVSLYKDNKFVGTARCSKREGWQIKEVG